MATGTKSALAASLRRLLEKKPLDDITVKEIVEDCEVNRQTFYYHFQDIYDLLRWFLEQETTAALTGSATWQEALLRAYSYIQENHILVYHVFRSTGRDHLDCHFYTMTYRITYDAVSSCSGDLPLSDKNKDFLAEFYMYALAGMMIGWVARGMREEPAELVDHASRMLDGEFRRAAEKFST